MNITENSFSVLDLCNEINPSLYLENFQKFYYYPVLEYSNDNCHILIDNKNKYINSDWTLISGISDVIHIYSILGFNIILIAFSSFINLFTISVAEFELIITDSNIFPFLSPYFDNICCKLK